MSIKLVNVKTFFHILDSPRVDLNLGKSISANTIYEGGDVYFDCSVRSRPPPMRILWKQNVSVEI